MSSPSVKPRQVVVDDSDPRVQYTSSTGWNAVQGSPNSTSLSGPAYQDTLHGIQSDPLITPPAGFSFSFFGSTIEVWVSSHIDNSIVSSSSDPNFKMTPSWSCLVDGFSLLGGGLSGNSSSNNELLCSSTVPLSSDPHQLLVTISQGYSSIWFDSIRYTPLSNVPLDNATILVDQSDPGIEYDGQWSLAFNGTQTNKLSQSAGEKIKFDFTGDAISFVGHVSGSVAASYSIDGSAPTSFGTDLDANTNQSNVIQFSSPSLGHGPHSLVVSHDGSGGDSLYFQYFLVKNGADPSTVSQESKGGKKTSIGPIVGGVIGGLVLIGLMVAFFFFKRRQSRSISVSPTEPSAFVRSSEMSTFPREKGSATLSAHVPSSTGMRSESAPASTSTALGALSPISGAAMVSNTSLTPSSQNILADQSSITDDNRVVNITRHQDSGVRIPADAAETIELPPLYTES